MKSELRTLLRDIKAAARIGHAESLRVALEGLLDLPEVAGNPPMTEKFLTQVILPAGEALSYPRLNPALLRPLATEPRAALRAIAASALARRWLGDQKGISNELIKTLGQDTRQDVRLALSFSLAQAGQAHPQQLLDLTQTWLQGDSPRLREIALHLLPTLAEAQTADPFDLLAGFSPKSNPEVRAALADALTRLAQYGLDTEVLAFLRGNIKNAETFLWVICKTMTGSWAAAHPAAALEILKQLAEANGPHKQIHNTLQALQRHGAEEAVQNALSTWLKSETPALAELAANLTD